MMRLSISSCLRERIELITLIASWLAAQSKSNHLTCRMNSGGNKKKKRRRSSNPIPSFPSPAGRSTGAAAGRGNARSTLLRLRGDYAHPPNTPLS